MPERDLGALVSDVLAFLGLMNAVWIDEWPELDLTAALTAARVRPTPLRAACLSPTQTHWSITLAHS
jgi:hypothetical protein